MSSRHSPCPGCGLAMPSQESAQYEGYYNASPECWDVYSEVLAEEYSNAVLFGQVHQLTVDAYAVQHAGGSHPDKSVGIHLAGLHLILEQDTAPPNVPSLHKQLADVVEQWPQFDPPSARDTERLTVLDVALADTPEEHAARSRRWANQIWEMWTPYHDTIVALTAQHLDGRGPTHQSGDHT